MRALLVVAILTQFLIGSAFAQDRPLFEPFRIGYPRAGSVGQRLEASITLDRQLRRIGLIASWHPFDDGLAAVRALHAGEIDLALDIAQHDVILAKLEDLSMVFVAQHASGHPDSEQASPDDMIARYTLASGFYADHREDALLVVVLALRDAAVSQVSARQATRPITIAQTATRDKPRGTVSFVTRPLLAASQHQLDRLWVLGQIPRQLDLTDVNYWMPLANALTR